MLVSSYLLHLSGPWEASRLSRTITGYPPRLAHNTNSLLPPTANNCDFSQRLQLSPINLQLLPTVLRYQLRAADLVPSWCSTFSICFAYHLRLTNVAWRSPSQNFQPFWVTTLPLFGFYSYLFMLNTNLIWILPLLVTSQGTHSNVVTLVVGKFLPHPVYSWICSYRRTCHRSAFTLLQVCTVIIVLWRKILVGHYITAISLVSITNS